MKKIAGKAFKLLLFLFLLIIINEILAFILVPKYSLKNGSVKQMYFETNNIDTLFLGSSHCYETIQPDIIDHYSKGYSYLCSTAAQKMDGSYYALRETSKYNDISTVYLECFFFMWNEGGKIGAMHQDRTDISDTITLADQMYLSWDKIRYLLNATSPEYYSLTFIPARRNWEDILQPSLVAETFRNNMERDFFTEYHHNRGFNGSNEIAEKGTFYNTATLPVITEEWIGGEYLEDFYMIVDYCEKNDIELILYSAPVQDFFILQYGGDYDAYVDRMEELATECGLSYYDFNLCKEEFLQLDTADFRDDNHLNINGSTKFCELFGEFFYGSLNRTADIFYDSYEEKLENMEASVFGLNIEPVENNKEDIKEYQIKPLTNITEDRITYTILNHIKNEEEEEILVVQEDSHNTVFNVSSEENGQIEIYAYMDGIETNHIFFDY